MKKGLTHIFVVLANFYMLSYVVGLVLMAVTMFTGALNPATVMLTILGVFVLCVVYQLTRHKFNFVSFGETLISNLDKKKILTQTKVFSVTRVPVFILMLLTLIISGNILDGLSEGQVYTFGNVAMFALLTGCSYYGMKYLVTTSDLLPILLMVAGLMMTALPFKFFQKSQLIGDFMFNVYVGFSVAWLIVGLIYKMKRVKSEVIENDDTHEKILFRYHSNVLDKITVETMWAEKVDVENGIYKLDSIPFYGPLIATDDEFFAEFDEYEQCLTYRNTVKPSGNSVVTVVITKEGFDKEIIRDEFKALNCTSEGLNESYFAMEILKLTNYGSIQKRLKELEENGIISFSEPCLSDKHKTDLVNQD